MKLEDIIDSLESIDSELNQDEPNISDIRVDVHLLLTELLTSLSLQHNTRAFEVPIHTVVK